VINADVDGVTRAAQHNLALIALGKLAKQKAKDPRIRQLGTVVQNDAEEGNEALRQVAAKMQIRFPDDMAPDQSTRVDEISKLEPDESFERELLDAMLYEQRQELGILVGVQMRAQDEHIKGLLERAARSMREAQRATDIERKPMKEG
jgi:putative membrane protein